MSLKYRCFHVKENTAFTAAFSPFVPSEGFEPPTTVPKTVMISISPRGLKYITIAERVNDSAYWKKSQIIVE